jgi:hypothetical protein
MVLINDLNLVVPTNGKRKYGIHDQPKPARAPPKILNLKEVLSREAFEKHLTKIFEYKQKKLITWDAGMVEKC